MCALQSVQHQFLCCTYHQGSQTSHSSWAVKRQKYEQTPWPHASFWAEERLTVVNHDRAGELVHTCCTHPSLQLLASYQWSSGINKSGLPYSWSWHGTNCPSRQHSLSSGKVQNCDSYPKAKHTELGNKHKNVLQSWVMTFNAREQSVSILSFSHPLQEKSLLKSNSLLLSGWCGTWQAAGATHGDSKGTDRPCH